MHKKHLTYGSIQKSPTANITSSCESVSWTPQRVGTVRMTTADDSSEVGTATGAEAQAAVSADDTSKHVELTREVRGQDATSLNETIQK